jgi:hypothetical protein
LQARNNISTPEQTALPYCLSKHHSSRDFYPKSASHHQEEPKRTNHLSDRRIIMFSRMQFRLSLLLLAACAFHSSWAFTSPSDIPGVTNHADKLRQQWIEKSVDYYSKVMREERRKNMGQISNEMFESVQYQQDFGQLATKHYFALRKIKDGQHRHAELIYRRIIDEIMNEEEDGHCDHAKLAVTTLLLALHCQRMGDLKKARSVFINFFRVVVVHGEEDLSECACSAKVLGAYALFEMKQGHINKSLEIAQKAVEFDQALEPVLNWKQFRDARARRNSRLKP